MAPQDLPRLSRKERSRAAILDGAARCFSELGFASCSMDAVSEAAGISKPTLYAHFSSKEALFDAVLLDVMSRMKDDPLPEVTTEAEAESALLALAKAHLRMTFESPGLGLMRAAVAEVVRRPAWAQELLASLADDQLERWLARVSRAGLLEIKSPSLAAKTFWSLVKGALLYPVLLGFRDPPDARERNRTLKEAVRVFMAAHTSSR